MNPVQSSGFEPAANSAIVETKTTKLRYLHHAMLPSRQLVNEAIDIATLLPTGRFRSI